MFVCFVGDEVLLQQTLFDAVVTAPLEAYWNALMLNDRWGMSHPAWISDVHSNRKDSLGFTVIVLKNKPDQLIQTRVCVWTLQGGARGWDGFPRYSCRSHEGREIRRSGGQSGKVRLGLHVSFTFSQRRFWLIGQQKESVVHYNMGFSDSFSLTHIWMD